MNLSIFQTYAFLSIYLYRSNPIYRSIYLSCLSIYLSILSILSFYESIRIYHIYIQIYPI